MSEAETWRALDAAHARIAELGAEVVRLTSESAAMRLNAASALKLAGLSYARGAAAMREDAAAGCRGSAAVFADLAEKDAAAGDADGVLAAKCAQYALEKQADLFASAALPLPDAARAEVEALRAQVVCRTCQGTGRVLHLYARGPNDPPGNAWVPCPACDDGARGLGDRGA